MVSIEILVRVDRKVRWNIKRNNMGSGVSMTTISEEDQLRLEEIKQETKDFNPYGID